MAYCTQTDLENRIGSQALIDLTDDTGTGSVDTTKLAEVITAACAFIDGYLRRRYAVPLTGTIPALIEELACAITIYNLYNRRQGMFGIPDEVKEQYDRAIARLIEIRNATMDLGIEDPPAPPSAATSHEGHATQYFTQTKLTYF